jgi:hypothetical protein
MKIIIMSTLPALKAIEDCKRRLEESATKIKKANELKIQAEILEEEGNKMWASAYCTLGDLEGRQPGNHGRLFNHTIDTYIRGGEWSIKLHNYTKAIENLQYLLETQSRDYAALWLAQLYMEGKIDETCKTYAICITKRNYEMGEFYGAMIKDTKLQQYYQGIKNKWFEN